MLRTFLTALWLSGTPAVAQDAPLSVSLPLMLKLVTYDLALADRGTGDFVVVVPHTSTQGEALGAVLATARSFPQTKIAGRLLRFAPVSDPGDDAKLGKALAAEKPSAVLILPGSTRIDAYGRLAREQKLYSLALASTEAEHTALFSVATRDGRPWPVVNLTAARELGVQLPSSVLKISKTIQ